MSEKLVHLRAGPRDVVDVHQCVIKQKTEKVWPRRAAFYFSEAKILLIEVLGNMVSQYRKYTLGVMDMDMQAPGSKGRAL